jgi:DNA-3-methyladenine glycosylase I
MSKTRCSWSNSNPLYIDYHDHEWARPIHDHIQLFELLMLEGMQAGLSWITILKKRDNYRQVFHQFNPQKIALMTSADVDELMQNEGIVRHRKKIEAIISNATIFLDLKKQKINFSDWLWEIVNHKPIVNHFKTTQEIPAQTELSQAMSKQLKKAGFKFVGPTICYAFMQAAGMVNDHTTDCFLYTKTSTTV